MLRLNLQKDPYWLDLPAGVRVKVRPLTSAIMNAAQSEAVRELRARIAQEPLADDALPPGQMQTALVTHLARFAILEWDGVMAADGSKPAEVTPEAVGDLASIWFMADAFWRGYTATLDALVAEGNGCAPSVAGSSQAARAIAKTATGRISPAAGA
ncbi:MAG: hypothetical protein ACK5QX_08130 [bacterium]